MSLVGGDALGDDFQLVGLQPGAIAVIGVGKAPCVFIARPARFNGEARAEVTDGGFATLAVLAEQLAAAFGGSSPTPVVSLALSRPDPLPSPALAYKCG